MLLLDTATIPVDDRIDVFNAAMLDASVPMSITHEQPEEPIHARMDSTSVSSTQHVRSIMCAPFISHIPPPVARSRHQGRRLWTPNGLYQVSVAKTGSPSDPF